MIVNLLGLLLDNEIEVCANWQIHLVVDLVHGCRFRHTLSARFSFCANLSLVAHFLHALSNLVKFQVGVETALGVTRLILSLGYLGSSLALQVVAAIAVHFLVGLQCLLYIPGDRHQVVNGIWLELIAKHIAFTSKRFCLGFVVIASKREALFGSQLGH